MIDRVIDRIFGPRIDEDGETESVKAEDHEAMLVKHRLTLRAVNAVLSDGQRRVADAIDETGRAIENARR